MKSILFLLVSLFSFCAQAQETAPFHAMVGRGITNGKDILVLACASDDCASVQWMRYLAHANEWVAVNDVMVVNHEGSVPSSDDYKKLI